MSQRPVLILKTGALGDVLRTTSILPGLVAARPGAAVHWLTARDAQDLVRHHPSVDAVHPVDPRDAADLERARVELANRRWGWVISLDDEEELCALAASLPADRLSGATLGADGERTYTLDTAPWFDMGLLSRLGKREADRRKQANTRSHPEIVARMLGLEPGEPELPLPAALEGFGRARLSARGAAGRPWIGLNTGAGGRWISKQLPEERVLALGDLLVRSLAQPPTLVVLGGPKERERNARLVRGLADRVDGAAVVDAGVDNALLEFAAIVDALDLLITSDSLALHVAVARRVPLVAFFAPTSAAEIELYGRGEKVATSGPDACSYRPDADNSELTPERLAAAALRVLAAHPPR